MGRKIVEIINIYASLSMFLKFYCHQDTESGSWGMEIGVVGKISTEKKVKNSMRQKYLYSTSG